MSGDVRILSVQTEHIDQIAQIEKICFSAPWSRKSLVAELENPNAVYLAAICGETVLGYLGMRVVLDEGHIMNLAVDPAHRRRGIARALLALLIARAQAGQLAFLTLEVRASNQSAIALYAGHGFLEAGRRGNYYTQPTEDALIMTLPLNGGELNA